MKFAEESCQVMEVRDQGRPADPAAVRRAGRGHRPCRHRRRGGAGRCRVPRRAGLRQLDRPGPPGYFRPLALCLRPALGRHVGRFGEQAILSAAVGQMGKFLGLPTGSAAGMADAKLPDAQAGYEKGITNVMAGLA